jgi:hypothetical protein
MTSPASLPLSHQHQHDFESNYAFAAAVGNISGFA